MTLFSKSSSKNAALSEGLQRKSSSSKESFSCEGINSVAGHAIEVRYTASAATHTTLAPSVCELHALQHDAVPCLGRSNPDAVPCLGRSNPDAVPCLGRSNPDLSGEDVTKSGHSGPLSALTLMAPRGYRDDDQVQHNKFKLRDVINGVESICSETPWPLLQSCTSDSTPDNIKRPYFSSLSRKSNELAPFLNVSGEKKISTSKPGSNERMEKVAWYCEVHNAPQKTDMMEKDSEVDPASGSLPAQTMCSVSHECKAPR
ncbi:uncharacterized protein LOC108681110 [Hyalella azteca]|uniref:Uncharacterized protein LOC108681110 n=1 Tax=Hyalella azteca TaxID=294128 RepID=A0A8B7PHW2_HYAAZ|nr:uncharacterized protein LOC108681110 [Hyalella azteca]